MKTTIGIYEQYKGGKNSKEEKKAVSQSNRKRKLCEPWEKELRGFRLFTGVQGWKSGTRVYWPRTASRQELKTSLDTVPTGPERWLSS